MPTLDLGGWTLDTLETGFLWLDGGSMFGSVPKPLWSRTNPPDERNRIRLAMRCLLARGHGRTIVIDVGLGDKSNDKFREIYRVESEPGLLPALAAHGVAPGDVTDVILTHLHFDHAGGSTVRTPEGLRPVFPTARWYVQRSNWDNAHAPNPRERASYLPENYDALDEAGVLTLWEGACEPWPGVRILPVHGHTRGQQVVRLAGTTGSAWYVADLMPTASHVRIPYVMGYDVAAIETMPEKRQVLEQAVADDSWIVLEHDPDVAMARAVADGDDFQWAERVPATAGTLAR